MRQNSMKIFILISTVFVFAIDVNAQNLTIFQSSASLEITVSKIEEVVDRMDLIRFETVVHETIAKNVGVNIDSTEVIFFEDPKLTTQLILCEQTAALDMPLRIMVWKEEGDTYMGYMDPNLLKRRFMIGDCDETLLRMSRLFVKIINDTKREL